MNGVSKAIALSILLTGCASIQQPNENLDWNNSTEIQNQITLSIDSYSQEKKLSGPECYSNNCREGNQSGEYGGYTFIRGWGKEKISSYQIYTVLFAPDWLYIDHAYDSKGNMYKVTRINDKDVDCSQLGCVIQEAVGVSFTEFDLLTFSNTGIRLKYYGNGFTSSPWFIPPTYFKAVLDTTNNTEARP